MSEHLATEARKKSSVTGRNIKQNKALGGRPSALTGWVERERKREEKECERGRHTAAQRGTAITLLILIEVRLMIRRRRRAECAHTRLLTYLFFCNLPLNQACPNYSIKGCVPAVFCPNQSRGHDLTNQLSEE